MVGYNVGNMGASYITTAYGIYINNQSGAATNYAIYAGTGKVRFGDQVGIGANPTAADQLYVTSSWSDFTATRSNINSLGYCNPSADVGSPYVFYSLVTNAYKLGPYNMYNVTANSAYVLVASVSGTLSYAVAYSGAISLSGATNGGIITNAYVFRANNPGLTAGNVGTIGTLYGFYVNNQGASFVTNAYGIYIENVVNATSKNYAIYSAGGISYHAGYSGFGQPTIPSVLLHAEDQTSTNNALLEVLRIGGRVSGTAVGAAGFGPSITLYAESATNASYRQQAQIDAQWTVATDASRKARLTLSAFDTAAREGLRIEASGSEAIIGMYGVTGTVRASHIADPTGGVVVDTECRAAVVSLLTAIENIGITKTS